MLKILMKTRLTHIFRTSMIVMLFITAMLLIAPVIHADTADDTGSENIVLLNQSDEYLKPEPQMLYAMSNSMEYMLKMEGTIQDVSATDVISCQDSCQFWFFYLDEESGEILYCCEQWRGYASNECRATWDCPE